MAKNAIADLSNTAASNTDIVGEDIQGSANVSKGDNVIRNLAKILADFYDSIGGTASVSGTDTYTVTVQEQWAAYATGLVLVIKPANANTGASTLNVTPSGASALGAKAIRRQGDAALQAGDMAANAIYLLRYDATYNTAAGAWVLMNRETSSVGAASTTDVLTGTDTSKFVTADSLAALWEKGADVASAGTVSLGEGSLFHITGTTTITDIDFATAKNGRSAWLIFDGALTLTHNSTTLVLPGGANITTAAGDMAYVVQDNSDNVYVRYFKADGTAVVSSSSSGTWTLIGTLSGSGVSTQTQALGATYKEILCQLDGVGTSNATANINFQLTDDGSTYDTARAVTISATANTDFHNGQVRILNTGVAATTKRIVPYNFTLQSTGALRQNSPYVTVSSQSSENGVTHSIRFAASAGTFNAGSISVYGLS